MGETGRSWEELRGAERDWEELRELGRTEKNWEELGEQTRESVGLAHFSQSFSVLPSSLSSSQLSQLSQPSLLIKKN